jgi:tRNA(Arg) A34 adenosine deaminase TadA
MTDEDYMDIALQEADLAAAEDEVPIGAVIVDPKTGEIIAKAHNRSEYGFDPSAHAEILAIRKASEILKSKRLWDLDLYVTLEPCTMCAAAISFARIRRLVFGAIDTKGGGVVSGVRFFDSAVCHHRPIVISDVKTDECAQKLRKFFAQKRVKIS